MTSVIIWRCIRRDADAPFFDIHDTIVLKYTPSILTLVCEITQKNKEKLKI